MTQALQDRFFTHYRFPRSILSNQSHNFENCFIKELCDLGGIHKICTTPYHLQGNGQCKQFNSTLISMIGTLQLEDKSHWRDFFPTLVHAFNCTKSNAVEFSPYHLIVWMEAEARPQPPVWVTNWETVSQSPTWLCKLTGGQTALGLQFGLEMQEW